MSHDRSQTRARGYQLPSEMLREHDALHRMLCNWIGLGDSFVLQCAAGVRDEDKLSAVEEEAVRAVYKFMRLAGISIMDIKV